MAANPDIFWCWRRRDFDRSVTPLAINPATVAPSLRLRALDRRQRANPALWREHGALAYHECVADDVKPGKWTSFPQSVKLKKDEVVVFSWIVYKSRAQRDRVMGKVMKDKRLAPMMSPGAMLFDGKRMIYGGFKPLVAL